MEGRVRPSRPGDIAVLEGWLKAQRRAGVEDSLYVNWSLTRNASQEGRLIVYEDADGDLPAYYWGPMHSMSGILEVRRDRRRRGIGRAIVESQFERAVRELEPLCYVSCAPQDSQTFWESMGFTFPAALRSYGGDPVGIRNLDIPLDVSGGENRDVLVRFVDEDRLYGAEGDGKIFTEFSPTARLASDGVIYFDRVVAFFDPTVIGEEGDLALELLVDGERVLLSKAKHDAAFAMGVRRCGLGFAVQRLDLRV
jgi:GNAT superfamily N-acetyltransferase